MLNPVLPHLCSFHCLLPLPLCCVFIIKRRHFRLWYSVIPFLPPEINFIHCCYTALHFLCSHAPCLSSQLTALKGVFHCCFVFIIFLCQAFEHLDLFFSLEFYYWYQNVDVNRLMVWFVGLPFLASSFISNDRVLSEAPRLLVWLSFWLTLFLV